MSVENPVTLNSGGEDDGGARAVKAAAVKHLVRAIPL